MNNKLLFDVPSSSTDSGSDSEDELDGTEEDINVGKNESTVEPVTLTTFCPDYRSVYGRFTKEMKPADAALYEK